MFKIFGILFLVLVFVALFALMLFASAIFSIIRKLRKMLHGDDDQQNNYTGRQRQQYSYRGGGARQQSGPDHTQYTQQSNTGYTDSETIIDTRSPHITSKRIFEDNEGEYVDFIEEK